VAARVARNKSVKLMLSSAHLTEPESPCVSVKAACHSISRTLCRKLDSLSSLRALQSFFCATGASLLLAASIQGMLTNGQRYALNFVDIDGHKFSTADGHMTVLVLATPGDAEKVRAVGDNIPDYCLGNARYKMITVIHFKQKHTAIGRKIATAFLRHRVKEEAKRLQARYDAKKIERDARSDIFTVTDFDGTALSQFSGQTGAANFHVFVFAESGELLQQWNNVPSAADLAAVLKQSDNPAASDRPINATGDR
jgi:hypothetical protein